MSADVFMILCSARSGSTWLRDCLNSHPDIGSESEFLHPDPGHGLFWSYVADRIAEDRRFIGADTHTPLLDQYIEHRRQVDKKAFGFDLKVEQLFYSPALETAVFWRSFKIIILERANLLNQIVSEKLMYHRENKGIDAHGDAARPKENISIDPRWLLHAMRNKKAVVKDFRTKALNSNSSCLRLSYEDISGPFSEDYFGKVLDFLEVDRRPLTSWMVKQNPYPMSEQVENWTEIRNVVENSEFAYTLHMI